MGAFFDIHRLFPKPYRIPRILAVGPTSCERAERMGGKRVVSLSEEPELRRRRSQINACNFWNRRRWPRTKLQALMRTRMPAVDDIASVVSWSGKRRSQKKEDEHPFRHDTSPVHHWAPVVVSNSLGHALYVDGRLSKLYSAKFLWYEIDTD